MRSRYVRWVLVLFVTAVAAAACDVDSSRRALPTTPATPTVGVTSVKITGPSTMNLDEPTQFTATALRSDGTSSDVTAQAAWRAFNAGLLTMSAAGLFTGHAKGETGISASFSGRSATMSSIIVVPKGTFRIRGTVRDAGAPVDAHLEIENAALGKSAIDVTAPSSSYTVYGVGGDTRIKVTKPGYQEAVWTDVVNDHRTIDFNLQLAHDRADIAGTYTLTITAADPCAASLPEQVRTRVFTASIQQAGPSLNVVLSGSQFAIASGQARDRFSGVLEAEQAIFRFGSSSSFYYYYFYSPDVIEVVAPNLYYGFSGVATAAVSSREISGTMNGSISTFTSIFGRPASTCFSGTHRFKFSR
jgi:hypothetical protein